MEYCDCEILGNTLESISNERVSAWTCPELCAPKVRARKKHVRIFCTEALGFE